LADKESPPHRRRSRQSKTGSIARLFLRGKLAVQLGFSAA
jgi:hypothetical protein